MASQTSTFKVVRAVGEVECIGFFGMRVDEDWADAAGVGNGAHSSGSAKYAGWVALEDASGGYTRLAQSEAEGNCFKTWHWCYRFVMAGRVVGGYRERMYHMARMRIRDIRRRPRGTGVANVSQGLPAPRPATIGDVFTSERAMALILRWHIRFPAHMVSGGGPGNRLRNALANAVAATSGPNAPAGRTPLARLATARNSLDFDAAGWPPVPP